MKTLKEFALKNIFDLLVFIYCFVCASFFANTGNTEGLIIIGFLTFIWMVITCLFHLSGFAKTK